MQNPNQFGQPNFMNPQQGMGFNTNQSVSMPGFNQPSTNINPSFQPGFGNFGANPNFNVVNPNQNQGVSWNMNSMPSSNNNPYPDFK